nr:PSD1 and planctomycete cytochrome C domain-containing protein [Pirellula staleyi]
MDLSPTRDSSRPRPCSLARRAAALLCAALVMMLGWCGATSSSGAAEIDFNRDIRPILAENCFYCHGQDPNKREADLRLDDREAATAKGAIVPGDAATSLLIERIHATDPDVQMPPPTSNRKLSDAQKQLLKDWITQGARYQKHWAYEPPIRPAAPEVTGRDWVRTPIDQFVLARLEQEKLAPSPEASRATLIRRLSIDLTGLPPSPEEVQQFVDDNDPLAYEKLVDRLLASPHYGERMALAWLDAARYADSNGFQQDGDTWQWMWRDNLAALLNRDLPFDEFTKWQLAGDLIPDATTEQKIASGFNRNHLLNGEGGAIAEEQRFVILFDRVDTTATTWLGLTMACAQCHDHKYDPITQVDYYSLMDGFNHLPESGTPQRFSSRIRVAPPLMELPTEENLAYIAKIEAEIATIEKEMAPSLALVFEGWRLGITADNSAADLAGLAEDLATIARKEEKDRSDNEKQKLAAGLQKYFDEKVRSQLAAKLDGLPKIDGLRKQIADYRADQIPRVMIMSDERARQTSVLSRGEYLSPTEPVSFNTPAFLPPLPSDAPKNRLGFAQWLFLPDHPLTARVQVNRMWQHFFGTGIVKTSEDFGVQSEYPLHGPLLDWLAVEFRENGWSVKKMHRLIVTSATYRQASRVTPELKSRDIENRLFARSSRFRMPSLVLRDWALRASGLLDTRVGGKPVYPYQPDGIWESLAITKERDFTYPASSGSDLYRRSLYTFWRRTVGPANMFDASNRQACRVRAVPTSTPLHALTTLNDPTWAEAARVLAERTIAASGNLEEQLSIAFARVVSRQPTPSELSLLRRAYDKQQAIFAADPAAATASLQVGSAPRNQSLDAVQHASLASVCLAIMNLDEALTRE